MPYGFPDVSAAIVRPFALATFRMSGAQLLQGLETGLVNEDMFLHVSGIRFRYDSRLPAGQRILVDTVHVGGNKLALDATYTVTANEGVLYFIHVLGIAVEDEQLLPFTAWTVVDDYIASRGVVEPEVSGRIRDVSYKEL